MGRAYCTYFDSNYLAQGLVMLRSLRRFDRGAAIRVLAFDDICARILNDVFGPAIHVTGVEAFHARKPALSALRGVRTPWAFYATHKPALALDALESGPLLESVTFIDADTWFFAGPEPMFAEIGAASIGLSPHRFPAASQHLAVHGVYNAGCVYWRANDTARRCLADWESECLEWCEEELGADGRFMNQGYLNRWPERYEGVQVIEHPGVNLAPWNICGHRLALGSGGITVDNRRLIFYHFSGLQRDAEGGWYTFYPIADCQFDFARESLYQPYFAAVAAESRLLNENYGIQGTGTVRTWTLAPDAIRL